jgi:hypothetical protein
MDMFCGKNTVSNPSPAVAVRTAELVPSMLLPFITKMVPLGLTTEPPVLPDQLAELLLTVLYTEFQFAELAVTAVLVEFQFAELAETEENP